MKKCIKCEKEKPNTVDYFKYRKGKDGSKICYGNICKKCNNIRMSEYRKANPRNRKEYYAATRKEQRNSRYKRKYGITFEEVRSLAEKQDNECAICKNPINWKDQRSFNVDHCHAKGEIRGILCAACNVGLGFFKDSPTLLHKAFKYLTL